jgi:hypothetical protein
VHSDSPDWTSSYSTYRVGQHHWRIFHAYWPVTEHFSIGEIVFDDDRSWGQRGVIWQLWRNVPVHLSCAGHFVHAYFVRVERLHSCLSGSHQLAIAIFAITRYSSRLHRHNADTNISGFKRLTAVIDFNNIDVNIGRFLCLAYITIFIFISYVRQYLVLVQRKRFTFSCRGLILMHNSSQSIELWLETFYFQQPSCTLYLYLYTYMHM